MITAEQRMQLHRMCKLLALDGSFDAIAFTIGRSGVFEDPQIVAQAVAEWQADYERRDYSVWPFMAQPRMPRPQGVFWHDEED